MASRVPPSKEPTPWMDRPAPPTEALSNPQDYKKAFQSRVAVSKFVDPCEAASKASMDCMERAHYNRDEVNDGSQPETRQKIGTLQFPDPPANAFADLCFCSVWISSKHTGIASPNG